MIVPFVDLAAQYRTITVEVTEALERVLSGATFVLGDEVAEFERRFAEYVGVRHCVGVSNGLDALRLSLMALDIGPGDEVVLPVNTFIATAFAVSAVGARPVLVDCDPSTYTVDIAAIETALTPRTRAIVPVHLTGQAAAMDRIADLASRRDVYVIEDAAQAHGTRYKDRMCGSVGDVGCFSFYPAKNLGAYGDAGAVTTDDPRVAERLRRLRNYGQRAKNEHLEGGLNARLDSLQAAILRVKLRHLEAWTEQRRAVAARYRELLTGVGDIAFQHHASDSTHTHHLFVIETARRDGLRRHLARAGVETGIHYPTPVHMQPAYRTLGYRRGEFPAAEGLAGRMLSLPMFAELSDEQIQYVVRAIRDFADGSSACRERVVARQSTPTARARPSRA